MKWNKQIERKTKEEDQGKKGEPKLEREGKKMNKDINNSDHEPKWVHTEEWTGDAPETQKEKEKLDRNMIINNYISGQGEWVRLDELTALWQICISTGRR